MSTPVKVMRRSSALLVLTTLALAGPLAGQGLEMPTRRLVRIGFGGGVVVPTSHAADVLENGINGQAFVLLDPGLGFPLRFNLGYQRFDRAAVQQALAAGQTTLLSGTAGLDMNLIRVGPLRLYLNAGLGAFALSDDVEGGTSGESSTDIRFGIDGGGGLALRLGRLDAFIEGRVQNVYTENGAIDRRDIRAVPVTFGILF
jgi:hypothetical protein